MATSQILSVAAGADKSSAQTLTEGQVALLFLRDGAGPGVNKGAQVDVLAIDETDNGEFKIGTLVPGEALIVGPAGAGGLKFKVSRLDNGVSCGVVMS